MTVLLNPYVLSAASAFDGVYFDSDLENFDDRFSDPGGAVTLGASSIAFSSASATSLDCVMSDTDSNPLQHAFSHFRWQVAGTIDAAWPGAGQQGLLIGGYPTGSSGAEFGSAIYSHGANASRTLEHMHANGSDLSSFGGFPTFPNTFTAPVSFTADVQRQGGDIVAEYMFDDGTYTGDDGPQTLTMKYDVTDSYTSPSYFLNALLRFVQGYLTVTYAKFSVSDPVPDIAIIGTSLTGSHKASTWANGYAPLLKTAFGGSMIVCGAPSAEETDWHNAYYTLLRMQPQKVLIELGSNEVINGRSLATIQTNLANAHDTMVAAGATVGFVNIIPWGSGSDTLVSDANSWLASNYPRVSDVYSVLTDGSGNLQSGYTAGGTWPHPNDAGHAAMATQVESDLTSWGWWV